MLNYASLITFVALFFQSLSTFSQSGPSDFDSLITSKDLKIHLSVIASDSLEGRRTGKIGQHLAAEYIANHFEKIGLEKPVESPIGKRHFQTVDLMQSQLRSAQISSRDKTIHLLDEFYLSSVYRDSSLSSNFVFVGYGIESTDWNDYAKVDLNNKVAVVLWGEPIGSDGKYILSQDSFSTAWGGPYGYVKKASAAKKRGADEVVFLFSDKADYEKNKEEDLRSIFRTRMHLPDDRSMHKASSRYGGVFSYEEHFPFFSGMKMSQLDKYKKSATKGKLITIPETNHSLTLKTDYNLTPIVTMNVLGLLKGQEKTNETIIVTAHYDHLGFDDKGIYNGADDDGSGTVTLLEIADAFSAASKAGFAPKRNILFMTVTGEELGLLGSKFYTNYESIIPLSEIVTNVNIDMVGRVDDDHVENPNYVYSIGSDRLSSELHELNLETAKEYGEVELDFTFDALDDPNNFYKRSDHYNFAKNNIPVVFYFNGSHDDYHQTTDTVEKIEFGVMEKRARLIFNMIWKLAYRDDKVSVDKSEEKGN